MSQEPVNLSNIPDFLTEYHCDDVDANGDQLVVVQCPYCDYRGFIRQPSYQPDHALEPHRMLIRDHLLSCPKLI